MAKPTYQPKKRKRATSHGFLLRAKTSSGRKIVRGRRRAGRTRLTA